MSERNPEFIKPNSSVLCRRSFVKRFLYGLPYFIIIIVTKVKSVLKINFVLKTVIAVRFILRLFPFSKLNKRHK